MQRGVLVGRGEGVRGGAADRLNYIQGVELDP